MIVAMFIVQATGELHQDNKTTTSGGMNAVSKLSKIANLNTFLTALNSNLSQT